MTSLVAVALLCACSVQPSYERPAVVVPSTWLNGAPAAAMATPITRRDWWAALEDPAIDALVAVALRDDPTLAEAAARVDQARAVLASRGAARLPSVGVTGTAIHSQDRMGAGTQTIGQSSASLGLNLAWELDLWGRVRAGRIAARNRLAAREADAEAARLSLVGDLADTVLALRACEVTVDIRDRDITSRETELRISQARLSFGNLAPVAVAEAEGNLAVARTDRITQVESCARLTNALVALSGADGGEIRSLLGVHGDIAAPPPFVAALPATVLLGNPGVVAAEREVAARWSEIAVAQAERLPRFDLSALLTGQWIRALGAGSTYPGGSVGVGMTGPLFDGGTGGANVRGAQAAYREAVAQLQRAVRTAVRDIEDGLAAQRSAVARIETSRDALTAAAFTLRANEARWRAGALARYELEESRRLYRVAELGVVTAKADRARAWVALIRRTGPTLSPGERG